MIASAQVKLGSPKSVCEQNDDFLQLFPHRGDFIFAEFPNPTVRPDWRTESRYPLSDRRIQQGGQLYGVRFGKQTNYLLIDLDPTSQYHPQQDSFSVTRIMGTLEPLGLVTYVPVQSSDRGGIHLYLPFEKPQSSWEIALAVQTQLEKAGFKVKDGQLEIFPNPKAYSEGTPTLYKGHRLPLQIGSYILNENWEPVYSMQDAFVHQWKFAQHKNTLDLQAIEKAVRQGQPKRFLKSGKARKFLNDLNVEIEPGWTGSGQTNRLLGKITCRERVFHHVLHGGDPLSGEALVEAIAQVARSLPGYEEFCNHQHELEKRIREYVPSALKRYYPYGSKRKLQPESNVHHVAELTWNQRQALAARERIKHAIADMLNQGTLPGQTTARFKALKSYRIGSDTLNKNRDLWDPKVWKPPSQEEFPPVEEKTATPETLDPLPDNEFPPANTNKLVGLAGSDAHQEHSEASPTSNVLDLGGSGGFSTSQEAPETVSITSSSEGAKSITTILGKIRAFVSSAKLVQVDLNPPDENYFHSTMEKEPPG